MTDDCIKEEPTETFREKVIGNGWKQGSILDLNEGLEGSLDCSFVKSNIRSKHNAKLIIISQDCDIANEGEEHVECMLLRANKKRSPSIRNGINPRKIQIEKYLNYFWDISAEDVYFLNKSYLINNEPFDEFQIHDDDIAKLRQWKANRYTRKGLPEEFVNKTGHIFRPNPKLGEKSELGLSESVLFKDYSDYISSIRVYCVERDDGSILCGFILLYSYFKCEDHGINPDEIEEKFEECLLDRIRAVEGVDLMNDDDSDSSLINRLQLSDVMSDMEFPLGATSIFSRYYFDPISFSDENHETEKVED